MQFLVQYVNNIIWVGSASFSPQFAGMLHCSGFHTMEGILV